MFYFKSTFLILATLIGISCFAQKKETYKNINTDRPGLTKSAKVVDAGQLLLQTGIDLPLSTSTARSFTLDAFLRYGISRRLEFGAGLSVLRYRDSQPLQNGFENTFGGDFLSDLPALALRYQVLLEKKYVPNLSLQFHYSFVFYFQKRMQSDRGLDATDAGKEYNIVLALSKHINQNLLITANIAITKFTVENLDYFVRADYNIGYYGTFAEIFAFNTISRFTLAKFVRFGYDAGFWLRLNKKTRLDFSLGRYANTRGNTNAENFFINLGATFVLK